jgi:hypothetical protein
VQAQNFWYNSLPQMWTFQNQVNVNASVPGTYFQFMQFAPDASYAGLQLLMDGRRVGLYALGHVNGEETVMVGYNNSFDWPEEMNDKEGWGRFAETQGDDSVWKGSRFFFKYGWTEGYPYRWARRDWLEPDGRHIRTSLALFDGFYGAWTWIGAVRHANATPGAYFAGDRPNAFLERFGSDYGYKSADFSNAWYQTPSGVSGQLLGGPDAALMIGDASPNTRLTTKEGGFTMEYGDGVPPADTSGEPNGHSVGWTGPYSWPDSPSNHPRFMPYHVACGQTGITVGPDQHTAADESNNWEPDAYYNGGTPRRYSDFIDREGVIEEKGSKYAFQGERYGEDFTYKVFGVQPGVLYNVKLYFVEHYWNEAGARRQDVYVGGQPVLSDFDIFAAAGNRKNKLVLKSFIAVGGSDGTISIRLVAKTTPRDHYASLTALEVM